MAKTTKKKKRTKSAVMVGVAAALSLSPLIMPADKPAHHAAHVKATYDPDKFTTGVFQEDVGPCFPEGEGGDPDLSKMKNRDKPPTTAFKKMTVAELTELDMRDIDGSDIIYTKKDRAVWGDNIRAEVLSHERSGVVFQGYFAYAEKQKKEACNCGSTEFVDIHTWLVDDEPEASTEDEYKTLRSEALVAEISPRLHGTDKTLHPNYDHNIIKKIARSHKQVRVSGWLTWDEEHNPLMHHTRGTLWEIHPILDIKVEVTPGKWKELDALDVANDLQPNR